jgi:hypothetical protein
LPTHIILYARKKKAWMKKPPGKTWLARSFSEEYRMNDEKWELLEEAPSPFQAEIIRGLLEAQDIPSILLQEGVGRAVGFTVGPLGVVQILVPTSEMERAEVVLNDYYTGKLALHDYHEEQDDPEQE